MPGKYGQKFAATVSQGDFLSETWRRSFQTEKTTAHYITSHNDTATVGTFAYFFIYAVVPCFRRYWD